MSLRYASHKLGLCYISTYRCKTGWTTHGEKNRTKTVSPKLIEFQEFIIRTKKRICHDIYSKNRTEQYIFIQTYSQLLFPSFHNPHIGIHTHPVGSRWICLVRWNRLPVLGPVINLTRNPRQDII